MFQVNPLLSRGLIAEIHMKNQDLFSSKDKSKKLKCRQLQFLFGALRVKEGLSVVNRGLFVFAFVC